MKCLAGGQASASYNVSPEDYLVPFSKRRHINIPEGLWQHYNSEYELNIYIRKPLTRTQIQV